MAEKDAPKTGLIAMFMPANSPGLNPSVRTYCRVTFFLYMLFFIYSSFTTKYRTNAENNFRTVLMVISFFTMLGVSERRKQPFKVWLPSILKGLTITYALFLLFIAQQNYPEAKSIWNILEPPLSEERAKKAYESWQKNCEITTQNLSNKLDRYSMAHLLGWVFLSFLIRDYYVMHMWAILTELVELTFGQLLAHFAECWWDQLVCDLIVTNLPGMYIGMSLIRYMGWEEFDWLGRRGKKSWREWEIWTHHKKIISLLILLITFTTQFMGSFFVPNAFHTSPTSDFNGYRLGFWFAIGLAAYKELYMYASEPIDQFADVGGHFLQIAFAVMFSEVTIMIKHYNDSVVQFDGSLSLSRKILWPIVISVWLLGYLNARRYIPNKPKPLSSAK